MSHEVKRCSLLLSFLQTSVLVCGSRWLQLKRPPSPGSPPPTILFRGVHRKQRQWLAKTALLRRSSPRRRSKVRAPDAKRAGRSRGWVVRMRIRSAMDPYERVLSCTVGSTASFGRQVRAPAVCPQNSVESPRTPPHSRRIVSCACAGPVGRAPTVAKELAESAALSSLASYSAARCTAQLLTRQALIRRAEAIFFGLDQAYQPSGAAAGRPSGHLPADGVCR